MREWERESERRSEYCSKYTVEQLRGWMSERKRRKRSIDIADRVIDGWGAYGDRGSVRVDES